MEKDKGLDHRVLRKDTMEYLVQYFQQMVVIIKKLTGVEVSI